MKTTPDVFQFHRANGSVSPYYHFETGHVMPAWQFGIVRIFGMDDTPRAWDFRMFRDPETGERACQCIGLAND